MPGQLSLRFPAGWGGKRAGAGRKPKRERAGVPHTSRPAHCSRHPLHVTVRVRGGLPSLRSQSLFGCVRKQLGAAKGRFVRIVHFSVQSNHIHLLVEANDRRCLARGMKGFAVRVARHVNGLLASRGSVWSDRYHAHALKTPGEVRNALVYVLFNHKKHGRPQAIDPRSSAQFFDGWSDAPKFPMARGSPYDRPVVVGETWLLSRGWKRVGGLRPSDGPRAHHSDRNKPASVALGRAEPGGAEVEGRIGLHG
jgi:putative transposase